MAEANLTDENFESEVLKKAGIVLVDFWAPWCGACKAVAPTLEEITKEADGFAVAKLNVDEGKETSAKYGIMSIPTVIIFKDGEIKKTLVGARSKEEYIKEISELK